MVGKAAVAAPRLSPHPPTSSQIAAAGVPDPDTCPPPATGLARRSSQSLEVRPHGGLARVSLSSGVMDRPRIARGHRRWPAAAMPWVVGVGAGLTSVIALAAWLLLSDPAVAADIAATGDLMPLVEAMFESLRSALAGWLAYL